MKERAHIWDGNVIEYDADCRVCGAYLGHQRYGHQPCLPWDQVPRVSALPRSLQKRRLSPTGFFEKIGVFFGTRP